MLVYGKVADTKPLHILGLAPNVIVGRGEVKFEIPVKSPEAVMPEAEIKGSVTGEKFCHADPFQNAEIMLAMFPVISSPLVLNVAVTSYVNELIPDCVTVQYLVR